MKKLILNAIAPLVPKWAPNNNWVLSSALALPPRVREEHMTELLELTRHCTRQLGTFIWGGPR